MESGAYSFVAADDTLYREPWMVAGIKVFKGEFVNQAVVEFWDAWREDTERALYPSFVKFTLISGLNSDPSAK